MRPQQKLPSRNLGMDQSDTKIYRETNIDSSEKQSRLLYHSASIIFVAEKQSLSARLMGCPEPKHYARSALGEAPLQLLDSNLYPPSVGGTNSWLRTWTLEGPEKHMQQRLFAREQKTKEVRPCRFCPSKFHKILSIIHLRTKQTSIWRCKEEGLGVTATM
ncbi:hypothetical protein BDV09DRAFT_21172 [Aspergillus tetrazonus]